MGGSAPLRAVLRVRVDVGHLGVADGVLDLVEHVHRGVEAQLAGGLDARPDAQRGQRLGRRHVVILHSHPFDE